MEKKIYIATYHTDTWKTAVILWFRWNDPFKKHQTETLDKQHHLHNVLFLSASGNTKPKQKPSQFRCSLSATTQTKQEARFTGPNPWFEVPGPFLQWVTAFSTPTTSPKLGHHRGNAGKLPKVEGIVGRSRTEWLRSIQEVSMPFSEQSSCYLWQTISHP